MMTRGLCRLLTCCVLSMVAWVVVAPPVRAQEVAQPVIASPTAQGSEGKPENAPAPNAQTTDNPKNDRLFLVIPNYATVEKPTAFAPISAKEKFKLGADDAFDPYSFLVAGVLAGGAQWVNDDPSWGTGWEGFGKRYLAGFADAADGSFMTTGVFPSIFHEDPR